jgi:AcrR family transcriptional regulator
LAGATSREITAAAGANLAAITYHFGSKDSLIAEALFGELQQFVQPALDALAGPGSPAELMLGVVQQLLAEFERAQDDALVYLDALLLAARSPETQGRALGLYSAIADQLAGVITDLVDGGLIPAWVDPRAMSSLIVAVANGIVLQTQLDPVGPNHVAMATQFAGLLLASGSGSA